MKGHIEVINGLKKILTNELTAVNQYFLHSRMCQDWGYLKLSETMYKEALSEMRHAKDIIDRILFLEGKPDLQKLHPLKVGVTVKQQMENDLDLEKEAIKDLKESIVISQNHSDFSSKDLLEKILINEEEHTDWLEAQLHIIKEVGEENYLSQQIHSK